VLDLRNEETIWATNRFMIYALFPQTNISIHVLWGVQKQNTVFATGKSILDRSSKTNVGELMLRTAAAATCQVAPAPARSTPTADDSGGNERGWRKTQRHHLRLQLDTQLHHARLVTHPGRMVQAHRPISANAAGRPQQAAQSGGQFPAHGDYTAISRRLRMPPVARPPALRRARPPASDAGLLDQPLTDPAFPHLGESTVGGHLAWAILLRLIDPYRLTAPQLTVANRAISRWRELVSFRSTPDSDPRAHDIDLAPLVPASRGRHTALAEHSLACPQDRPAPGGAQGRRVAGIPETGPGVVGRRLHPPARGTAFQPGCP
jgi:hypothetical protein